MFEPYFLPLLASAEEIIDGRYITTTASMVNDMVFMRCSFIMMMDWGGLLKVGALEL